jgi:hypothetical protein
MQYAGAGIKKEAGGNTVVNINIQLGTKYNSINSCAGFGYPQYTSILHIKMLMPTAVFLQTTVVSTVSFSLLFSGHCLSMPTSLPIQRAKLKRL